MNIELKNKWEGLVTQFEALNQRERMIIFAAILTVFYGVFTYLIEPVLKEQSKLNVGIVQDTTSANNIDIQLTGLANKQNNNQLSPKEIQIAQLKEHIAALEQEVVRVSNQLIKPEKMPDLLSDLLSRNEHLTLVSLNTLPITGLFDDEEKSASNQRALPIFKHGVELTVEGRYLDLLSYVASVEQLPWQLHWDNATLAVDKKPTSPYPLSKLTMTVSTLSLEKNWLSI